MSRECWRYLLESDNMMMAMGSLHMYIYGVYVLSCKGQHNICV